MSDKNVDISHLPSPDEIEADISHLPSPDELSLKNKSVKVSPKVAEEWSKLESLGQGAKQGITAGFSDELAGLSGALKSMAKSPLKTITGNYSPQELEQLYRTYRDIERGKNKEAEKQNPLSYVGGNILGGVGGAIAAPGLMAPKTIAGMGALGSAIGAGTSNADILSGKPKELESFGKDVLIGGGVGTAIGGVAKVGKAALTNPEALRYGQAGVSLFGEGAQKALKDETEQFAQNVVDAIGNEKSNIGQLYQDINDANLNKKIDLTQFVQQLKESANNLSTELPEQARDKKAIMDLVAKFTQGPEVKQSMVTGGKFSPVLSSKEELENEAKKMIESQRQLGTSASSSISPSEDNSLLTRLFKINKPQQTTEKIIQNTEQIPIEEQLIKPDIAGTESTISAKTVPNLPGGFDVIPQLENVTTREGGSLTPSFEDTRKLRTDLGTLAYEKNLSNQGEQFAKGARTDLSRTVQQQVSGLSNIDSKYEALKNVMDKLGIKGDEEDVIRMLGKLTSENQGKEILVKQALEGAPQQGVKGLTDINPQLSKTIQNEANILGTKEKMINDISNIGSIPIMGRDIRVLQGVKRNISGIRSAAGNALGLAESKYPFSAETTKQTIKSVIQNPFSVEKLQENINPSSASKKSIKLYNMQTPELQTLATQLKSIPGVSSYGDKLDQAIKNDDQDAINRINFLILSNPSTSRLLDE